MINTKDKQELSKNWLLLSSFVLYCKQHPELTFWQAIAGWSKHRILAQKLHSHYTMTNTCAWGRRDGF